MSNNTNKPSDFIPMSLDCGAWDGMMTYGLRISRRDAEKYFGVPERFKGLLDWNTVEGIAAAPDKDGRLRLQCIVPAGNYERSFPGGSGDRFDLSTSYFKSRDEE